MAQPSKWTPNPHQESIFPTYRTIQRLDRPQRARGHLSLKISDRWHLSRVISHSHCKPIILSLLAGPTHTSWPTHHLSTRHGGREEASSNKESPKSQPNSAGNLEDNLRKVHRISNPTGFRTSSPKFGWNSRLI